MATCWYFGGRSISVRNVVLALVRDEQRKRFSGRAHGHQRGCERQIEVRILAVTTV